MIMRKNFKKAVILGIAVMTLFVAGCYKGRQNALPGSKNEKIVAEIKEDIANNPSPKNLGFIEQALYDLYPKAFSEIAKSYFEEASKINDTIGSSKDEKPSFLSGQPAEFKAAFNLAKEYYGKGDWLKTYRYSESALEEGYYLLPYYTPDEKLDSLFATMLKKYESIKNKEKETVSKLQEVEQNGKISKDSWLNLSYPESITDDIENNFSKQMNQFITGYKNAKSSKAHDFPTDVTMARNLGSGLSDIQMMRNKLNLAGMVISGVRKGSFASKDRELLLNKYKKLSEDLISKANPDKKSWGERLLYFSKSSLDAGKSYEKKNFYSFALVLYQGSYIFAEFSEDWAHYPDTIHYYNPKEDPPPLDKLLSYRDQSIKEFYEIETRLDALAKQGKLCFNIRYLTNIFYKSWFNVGDGFLKEFVKRKGHWADMGNIAYLNIGPVPNALKILMKIENDVCKDNNSG